jgi:hypothetical protein
MGNIHRAKLKYRWRDIDSEPIDGTLPILSHVSDRRAIFGITQTQEQREGYLGAIELLLILYLCLFNMENNALAM